MRRGPLRKNEKQLPGQSLTDLLSQFFRSVARRERLFLLGKLFDMDSAKDPSASKRKGPGGIVAKRINVSQTALRRRWPRRLPEKARRAGEVGGKAVFSVDFGTLFQADVGRILA